MFTSRVSSPLRTPSLSNIDLPNRSKTFKCVLFHPVGNTIVTASEAGLGYNRTGESSICSSKRSEKALALRADALVEPERLTSLNTAAAYSELLCEVTAIPIFTTWAIVMFVLPISVNELPFKEYAAVNVFP